MQRVRFSLLLGLLLAILLILPQAAGYTKPALQDSNLKLTSGKWTTGKITFESDASVESNYTDHTFEINFEVSDDGQTMMGTLLYSKLYKGLSDPSHWAGSWASRITNGTIFSMTAFQDDNIITYVDLAGVVKSPTSMEGTITIGWSNGNVIATDVKFTAQPAGS